VIGLGVTGCLLGGSGAPELGSLSAKAGAAAKAKIATAAGASQIRILNDSSELARALAGKNDAFCRGRLARGRYELRDALAEIAAGDFSP
jgi:hypothetical protein